jgi:hypothetical protein
MAVPKKEFFSIDFRAQRPCSHDRQNSCNMETLRLINIEFISFKSERTMNVPLLPGTPNLDHTPGDHVRDRPCMETKKENEHGQ